MNETELFEKVGKRYKSVGKRIDQFDLYRNGAYLIVVKPGSRSIVHNVDIAAASVRAAMKIAADAMVDSMGRAADLQPSKQTSPITLEQRALLDQLAATGFNTSTWTRGSFMDIIDAGLRELKAVMDSE